MKRVILFTAALLTASYLLRSDADELAPPRPPAPPTAPAPPHPPRVVVQIRTGTEAPFRSTSARSRGRHKEAPAQGGEAAPASEAVPATPFQFPDDHNAVVPPSTTRGLTHVVSELKSTTERAEQDARVKVSEAVMGWLVPEVPTSWKAPQGLVNSVVVGSPTMRSVEREYATLEQAALTVDLSPKKRAAFLKAYHREQGLQRLASLGAVLTFVLACLGIVTSYIRTDEATKGYYTNRLRLAAAAGVGAGGFLLYRVLT